MSPELQEKLKKVLGEVKEIYKISLFVVVKPENSDFWDLVIGGKDLDKNTENLKVITKIVNKYVSQHEIVLFSRLALLDYDDNPFVKDFNTLFDTDFSMIDVQNCLIGKVYIKQAYLFYSHRD